MLGTKTIPELIKENADIILLLSDRGGQKSTDLQLFFFDEWLKNNQKLTFFISRPKSDETIGVNWFSEFARKEIESTGYQIGVENIKNFPKSKMLTLNSKPFGIVLFASLSSKYKSNFLSGFEFIKYGALEECVEEQQTQNYSGVLQGLLSIANTVCRKNKRTLFLLGNDIILPNKTPALLSEINFFENLKFNEVFTTDFFYSDDYKKDGIYKVLCWYFGNEKEKTPNFLLPIGDIYNFNAKKDKIIKEIPYIFNFEDEEYRSFLININGNASPVLYVSNKILLNNFENKIKLEIKKKTDEEIKRKILEHGFFLREDFKQQYFEILKKENKKHENQEYIYIDFNKKISINSIEYLSSDVRFNLLNFKKLFNNFSVAYSDRKIKNLIERR